MDSWLSSSSSNNEGDVTRPSNGVKTGRSVRTRRKGESGWRKHHVEDVAVVPREKREAKCTEFEAQRKSSKGEERESSNDGVRLVRGQWRSEGARPTPTDSGEYRSVDSKRRG